VRVSRRLSQNTLHSVDQLVRSGMLEQLGFLVHPVPREPEDLHQEQLQHPMPANQPESLEFAPVRQPRAIVRHVLHQVPLRQPLQHPRHRPRRDAQPLRNRGCARGRLVATEQIDCLEVVFNSRRRHEPLQKRKFV
jgi:hypothetical protein